MREFYTAIMLFFIGVSAGIAQDKPAFFWQFDNMITPTKYCWSFGFELRPTIGKRLTLGYPLAAGTHFGERRLYVHTSAGLYYFTHAVSDSTTAQANVVLGALGLFVPESIGIYLGPIERPYAHFSIGVAGVDYWKTFGKPFEDSRYTLSMGLQYIRSDDYSWKTAQPFIQVFHGSSFNNGVNEWGVKFGVSFVPDNYASYKSPGIWPTTD